MLIVTTSYQPNHDIIARAKKITIEIDGLLVDREKLSIPKLLDKFHQNKVIIVGKNSAKYFSKENNNPFFFHPNMAVLRIKRLKQGDNDSMVQISNLKLGDHFLDCTLGLASDSIVASFVVGEQGRVLAFESQPTLAAIVKDGLKMAINKDTEIIDAMKRIEVVTRNHYDGLKSLPDKSFDVVYFDPMFRDEISKSAPLHPMRNLANSSELNLDTIREAKRVAKRIIILKERNFSKEFERLGFVPITRSSSITYGVISLNGDDYN